MSQENGIVHLWDLPEKKVYVKLPALIQKMMLERALMHVKSEDDLARLYSNQGTLNDFKHSRYQSTNLGLVKKLSSFLIKNGQKEFSLESLERKIELIKTKAGKGISDPKFPLNFDCKAGARIVSAFMFDGGIRQNLIPFYVNEERELIERVLQSLRKVVGDVDYLEYFQHGKKRINFIDFPQIFGMILHYGLRIPVSRKIWSNPSAPKFILNGNTQIKKIFLQQAFDDDGTVKWKSRGKRIKLGQNNSRNESPLRLTQLKDLLESFDIRVTGPYYEATVHTKRGYTSYRWAIEISNHSDIKKFVEKIDFSLERKRKDVKKLLSSYKSKPTFKRGTVFKEVLKVCKELSRENKKITNKNVAEKMGRTESYARNLTLKMFKEGKLKISKKRVNLGGRLGSTKKEFELVFE